MKLFDFQLLDKTDQIDYLYENGTFVGKRRDGLDIVLLYQVEGFYVEVFYQYYRKHPKKVRCFRSTVLLDPYLESIDVEHLV